MSKIIFVKYLSVRLKLAHEFLACIKKVNGHKKESNAKSHKTST